MIPMKHDNNKPAAINGGGLGGLDHVGRKSPMPRPAPANLMNPSNQSLANGLSGGLGMTTNQIRNAHPTGTSQNHISAMKKHMNTGNSFPVAHNSAIKQGFPAKRNMGLSMPKPKTLGFFLVLSAVATGSAYYYRRRNLADKLADEEDDAE
jgi:hypothetical protein